MNPYDPPPGPGAPNPYGPSGFGPPGGPPPPGNPYGGIPGPPADDNMAWISVALSSFGWVSCCCGFIPIIGIIGGLAGFASSIGGAICGYLAWQKAKQQNTRTDIAMIGLVLGVSRLIVMVLFIGLAVVLMIAGVGMAEFEQYSHSH